MQWNEEFRLWWPENENESVYKYMLARVTDVDVAVKRCRTLGVAVQAGGFIGMWGARIGRYFERVHVMEPVPSLFEACAKNTNHLPHVRCYSVALGETMGYAPIEIKRGGRTTMHKPTKTDLIPQITIDSLCLPRCDALFLDVERYELQALKGALQTIERFSPVITLEVHEDMGNAYRQFMKELGYRDVEHVHADWIFVRS